MIYLAYIGLGLPAALLGTWLAISLLTIITGNLHVTRWLWRLPALLLVVAGRYPAAPLAVLFRQDRSGALNNNSATGIEPRLPAIWAWLDTADNSLYGDDGHKARVGDYTTYWAMVRWLWRNGGHDFNYRVIGCPDIPAWRDDLTTLLQVAAGATYYWLRWDDYWLYRRHIPIGAKRLELFFGWSLFGVINGRCKYVCQVRLKDAQ